MDLKDEIHFALLEKLPCGNLHTFIELFDRSIGDDIPVGS